MTNLRNTYTQKRVQHHHFMNTHRRTLKDRTNRKTALVSMLHELQTPLIVAMFTAILCLFNTLYETGYFNTLYGG